MTGNPAPRDVDAPWNPIVDEDGDPIEGESLEDILGDGLPEEDEPEG